MRRRMVEVSKVTRCDVERPEVAAELSDAIRSMAGADRVVMTRKNTRKGTCVTVRAFESRETLGSFAAPAPLLPVKGE